MKLLKIEPILNDEQIWHSPDRLENYTNKGAPYGGAEGSHYKKEPAFHNPNRTRFTKF